MRVFHGSTADVVWLEAAAAFEREDGVHRQESRAGTTKEILGATFEITEPRQRWTVSRQPALNPAFAIAEVIWIVAGRQDAAFLNFWNPALPKYAGNVRKYHGAYGHRLKYAHKVDQLATAYETLRDNPDSRQVVLQIWNPPTDLPVRGGQPAAPDIPCNLCSILKLRQNKLEWTQILRSNDLILGVPHNFVQFTSLQELLASWLGVEVGTYRHYSDCLHIYTDSATRSRQTHPLPKAEPNTDVFSLSKPESDVQFALLVKLIGSMMSPRLTSKNLKHLVFETDLSPTLQNWLLVLGADCARRNSWLDLATEFNAASSNPALRQLWDRWLLRTTKFSSIASTALRAKTELQGWLPLRFA